MSTSVSLNSRVTRVINEQYGNIRNAKRATGIRSTSELRAYIARTYFSNNQSTERFAQRQESRAEQARRDSAAEVVAARGEEVNPNTVSRAEAELAGQSQKQIFQASAVRAGQTSDRVSTRPAETIQRVEESVPVVTAPEREAVVQEATKEVELTGANISQAQIVGILERAKDGIDNNRGNTSESVNLVDSDIRRVEELRTRQGTTPKEAEPIFDYYDPRAAPRTLTAPKKNKTSERLFDLAEQENIKIQRNEPGANPPAAVAYAFAGEGVRFFENPYNFIKETIVDTPAAFISDPSGTGFQIGQELQRNPTRATGENLFDIPGLANLPKLKNWVVAQSSRLDPKFRPVQKRPDGSQFIELDPETTLEVAGGWKTTATSVPGQVDIAGTTPDVSVSALNSFYRKFGDETVKIDKPKPSPSSPEIETSLFLDPEGNVRTTRLGIQNPSLFEELSGNVDYKLFDGQPQIILLRDTPVDPLPKKIVDKLRRGESLTKAEQARVEKLQQTPTGTQKPLGKISGGRPTSELEVTVPRTEDLKKLGGSYDFVTIINNRRVPIFDTSLTRQTAKSRKGQIKGEPNVIREFDPSSGRRPTVTPDRAVVALQPIVTPKNETLDDFSSDINLNSFPKIGGGTSGTKGSKRSRGGSGSSGSTGGSSGTSYFITGSSGSGGSGGSIGGSSGGGSGGSFGSPGGSIGSPGSPGRRTGRPFKGVQNTPTTPKGKRGSKKKKYFVEIRKGGRWVRRKTSYNTRAAAEKAGAEIVRKRIAASYRVVEIGGRVQRTDSLSGFTRSKLDPSVQVELPQLRLDTPGELSDIRIFTRRNKKR